MCRTATYYDGPPAEVWRNTTRTARKPHRCSTCRAEIAPGEKYRSHASIFEGVAYSAKACATCVAVIDAFGEEHHELHSPGTIIDALEVCIDEDEEGVERWVQAYEAIRARRGGTFIDRPADESPAAGERGGAE